MSKALWITTGVVVAAVGMTAIVANAERGGGDRRGAYGDERGYGHDRRGYRRHERRGRHEGRRGQRREVTKEDFDARTRSRFARWDANSDGVVDAGEAEARIARRIERRFNRHGNRRMERILRRLDTDRDGKVTKQEMEARVTERFKRMDLTSDGRITDDDLPPMLRDRDFLSSEPGARRRGGRRGHRHGGRGRRMLRQLAGADTNKDGAVTLQELQERAAKRFQRFDRNQDGTLDEADRDMLLKETVDYRVLSFMHRFGAGKEGQLSLDQFTKHRNERFARMDADGDGVLKGREIRRHRGRGGKRHGRRGHRRHHGDGPFHGWDGDRIGR